jgi:uncharacterized protein YjbJ (UPF0337 family)
MKTLNLDSLLADLSKTSSLEKAASEVVKPNISAELEAIMTKKASDDVTTSALAAGEALAKELLTKLAADNLIVSGDAEVVVDDDSKIVPNQTEGSIDAPLVGTVTEGLKRGATSDDVVDEIEDSKQTKQAQLNSENSEMARNIMQKIAQIVGEATTTPAAASNTEAAAAPNLIQSGNAVMTAQDDAKVLPLPGAEGSLNSILEAIVARAEDQGAVSDDLVNGDKPASSAETHDGNHSASVAQEADEQEKAAAVNALVEAGCDFESAVSMVKEAEEMINNEAAQQEKVAAVTELCASGYDFESAVELVKQAQAELSGEGSEMDKVAAVNEFISQGHSFDEAVELVKQATLADKAKDVLGKVKDAAGKAADSAKGAAESVKSEGFGNYAKRYGSNAAAWAKANKGKAGAIAAGAAGLAGLAAAKRSHEKKAAFDALVEAGVDFESAMAMVKQAEVDVYGE